MDDPVKEVEMLLLSVNMNLSLAHAETALVESWEALLRQVVPFLWIDATVRPIFLSLSIAASISYDITGEKREGGMMASIHGGHLSLVLALLEVAWFSSSDSKSEIGSFMKLVRNLRGIVLNEAQLPARSFLSMLPDPFHRPLLYFCAKQGRSLLGRPKTVNADQRLTIAQIVEATLNFVIDSFLSRREAEQMYLDRDMESLVSVFERYIRPDIDASSTSRLT